MLLERTLIPDLSLPSNRALAPTPARQRRNPVICISRSASPFWRRSHDRSSRRREGGVLFPAPTDPGFTGDGASGGSCGDPGGRRRRFVGRRSDCVAMEEGESRSGGAGAVSEAAPPWRPREEASCRWNPSMSVAVHVGEASPKTGAPEKPLKPVAVTKTISDVVTDTPHKIFVGGISKTLSSDMLVEIVSTFGLLRSYHFEFNDELHASIAFLEYADHSVTMKACAGLNGIKLGGRVLTAVRAIPDHHHQEKEASDAAVSYIIPDHAKPLLADPTPVLQLKNLFDRDEELLLSEAELDEVLEDVRLECARFGTLKSVNIVWYDNSSETATVVVEQTLNGEPLKMEAGAGAELDSIDSNQNGGLQPVENVKGLQNAIEDNNPTNPVPGPLNLAEASGSPPACFNIESSVKSETCDAESVQASDVIKLDVGDGDSDLGVVGGAEIKREGEHAQDANTDLNATNVAAVCVDGGANGQSGDLPVFEGGCVLVEYSRAEASCAAAHCLHGRLFGERIVVVGYVPHDLYRARFHFFL